MINRSIRDLIADDSYAISFQSLGQYRSALLKELDSQAQDTRTDDEIIRFLDDNSWGLIDGDLEYNRDGSWRWTYTNQLDRYDGDNDWEKMDATDTILDLIRYIRNPSSKNIREPVVFRTPLENPSSGIYLEACDRERSKWVVRNYGTWDKDGTCHKYLNKEGKWELPNAITYLEFLEKFSWPTKEEASSAYYARYRPLTLQQQQAARIAELEDLLKRGIQS